MSGEQPTHAVNVKSGAKAKPSLPQPTSTSLFRALNFELFVKPNKLVMAAGVLAFSSCLGYIIYWRATGQHKLDTYMALNEKGELEKTIRTSRWD
ncbi:hypothetical protein HELRODRAFT_83983 [Helobdella robusta]|uniref:Small integral membrane protein 8 n=1 Tax=Helobdella robusta TaxID=6412 RepID=T1G5C6_HELRO|nr:hypothetical protein HELRODRAFT_83983 [Helobdella robusta]ESN99821.1 hypothetical protein HELRODRAFT_83983 [Helobdella robusta]